MSLWLCAIESGTCCNERECKYVLYHKYLAASPCKKYRCVSVQYNRGNRNEVKEATCLAPWRPVSYLYLWSWHRTVILRVWKVTPPYTLKLGYVAPCISFSADTAVVIENQTQRVATQPVSGVEVFTTRVRNFEQWIKLLLFSFSCLIYTQQFQGQNGSRASSFIFERSVVIQSLSLTLETVHWLLSF